MMDVTAVEKATDVFGTSVNDFDPWADSGDGGGFGEDEGFGDFGDFKAMEGEKGDDHSFFRGNDDVTAGTTLDGEEAVATERKSKSPQRSVRRMGSHRGHTPTRNSVMPSCGGKEKIEEGSSSTCKRAPLRRRSSSRRLTAESLAVQGSEAKGSATKEANDRGDVDSKTKDKEHSTSGQSRCEALRVQRNSFRPSKGPVKSENDEHSSPKSEAQERPIRPRRQSSSRRLMAQVETPGNRQAAQKSVRSLYRDDGQGEEEKSPADNAEGHDGAAAFIVSHSRMQRPPSRRNSLAKSISVSPMVTSPDGEHRRAPVGKSLSMNQKLDSPSEQRRGAPQRVKSAIVPRPRSIRGSINQDALEKHPKEGEELLSSLIRPNKGSRQRPPLKSNSMGAISVRERRHLHKQRVQGDEQEDVKPTTPSRLSRRRLGSQDGDMDGNGDEYG